MTSSSRRLLISTHSDLAHNFYIESSPLFKELVALINAEGFKAGFVGGVTRDYILHKKYSTDVDIELQANEELTLEELYAKWDQLKKSLSGIYNIKILEFNIIQVLQGDHEFELTLPRVETFLPSKGQVHKNFFVEHYSRLDYSLSLLRRDFTINAIVFEYDGKSKRVIDPLNGLVHIEEKKLHYCGPNFGRDPIRFLRAFRFKTALEFKFSIETQSELQKMNFTHLSEHYLSYELSKSGHPFFMLGKMVSFVSKRKADNYFAGLDFFRGNKLGDLYGHLSDLEFRDRVGIEVSLYPQLTKDQKEILLEKLYMNTKKNRRLIVDIDQNYLGKLEKDYHACEDFDDFKDALSFNQLIVLLELFKNINKRFDLTSETEIFIFKYIDIQALELEKFQFIRNVFLSFENKEFKDVAEKDRKKYMVYLKLEKVFGNGGD